MHGPHTWCNGVLRKTLPSRKEVVSDFQINALDAMLWVRKSDGRRVANKRQSSAWGCFAPKWFPILYVIYWLMTHFSVFYVFHNIKGFKLMFFFHSELIYTIWWNFPDDQWTFEFFFYNIYFITNRAKVIFEKFDSNRWSTITFTNRP